MTWHWIRLTLSLGFLLLPAGVHAQAPAAGTIQGQVTFSHNGSPASGITVYLNVPRPPGDNGLPTTISAVTDALGQYSLTAVPWGTYRISVKQAEGIRGRSALDNMLGDLRGKFACGRQHQGGDAVLAELVGLALALGELVQQGQGEGGRLAGARLGAAEEVVAVEDGGDRLGLDGGGDFVALLVHGLEDGRSQFQFIKGHWGQKAPSRALGHRPFPGVPGVSQGQMGSRGGWSAGATG